MTTDTKPFARLGWNLPIALTYLALGSIALLFAKNPDFSSAVFPASGLALGSVLCLGARVLPGVWLGAFAFESGLALFLGLPWENAILIAFMNATGAALQAWLGPMLIRHVLGKDWPHLEHERSILFFLALGGVVASLVSATIGIVVLTQLWMPMPNPLFAWWNWYVGDALGILVFAPLTVCFLMRSNPLWKERLHRLAVPMLFILLVVGLAFYGTTRWAQFEQQVRFDRDAESIEKLIADRVLVQREILSSLRRFVELTPDLTYRQFERFTAATLLENPDIFALSFNAFVGRNDRANHEMAMAKISGYPEFKITERDAERRLIRAAERDEYVSVSHIAPLLKNVEALGYDINSENIRRDAIARARLTKNMAATSPIILVQEKQSRLGVLILMPVYRDSEGSPQPDDQRLRGFAVVVLNIQPMIDLAIRNHLPAGISVELNDLGDPVSERILYRVSGEAEGGTVQATRKMTLAIADRQWGLTVLANENYAESGRSWVTWAVGAIGLVFVFLMQALMLGMAGRTYAIQRQVDAKIIDLQQKNGTLRDL